MKPSSEQGDLLDRVERKVAEEAAERLPVPDQLKPIAETGIRKGLGWLIGKFKRKKKK